MLGMLWLLGFILLMIFIGVFVKKECVWIFEEMWWKFWVCCIVGGVVVIVVVMVYFWFDFFEFLLN